MTHYAFANSIMNLSVLVPGYVSGLLSEKPTQIIILDKLNLTNWVPQEFLGYELFFYARDGVYYSSFAYDMVCAIYL
ncbi:hypothetical protein [Ornithobacterium rhinotracheale]|uniref:hypothetical protein n=1 Tax=Ornithobacterium rhinotracheale TaxID=28251 RepID=UPI0038735CED